MPASVRKRATALFLALAVMWGCSKSVGHPLSQDQASALAVSLANSKCMEEFHEAPFREHDFPLVLKDDTWIWGDLDLSGVNGYSARVSFNRSGGDRNVEVFYATDKLRTLYR